jgi:gamma-glutamylcyclotransferase (GGCT)/AIG2-like uncharacterized protein YtfP
MVMAGKAGNTRESDTEKALLFVYGTLMRGGKLHHALAASPNVAFAGVAKIEAELYRLPGEEYPGAVPTSKRNRFVHGELFNLSNPDSLLRRIDKIEGCDEGLFERKIVDAWQNRKKRKAWTYFYAKSISGAEHLPHGRFHPVHAVV